MVEGGAEDIRKSLDEIFSSLESKIRDLERKMEEDASITARDAMAEVREILRSFRRSLEDALEKIKSLEGSEASKVAKDLGEYVERKAEDLRRRVRDLVEKIRSRYGSKKPSTGISSVAVIPLRLAEDISRSIARIVEETLEAAEQALERVSTTVLSVRIRDDDLKIIDSLVEGGVFKSRSEAVSFFTHKGIETSMEWINKIKDKLKKIKELQDEIRSELSTP